MYSRDGDEPEDRECMLDQGERPWGTGSYVDANGYYVANFDPGIAYRELRDGLDAIFDLSVDDNVDDILKRIRHVLGKVAPMLLEVDGPARQLALRRE